MARYTADKRVDQTLEYNLGFYQICRETSRTGTDGLFKSRTIPHRIGHYSDTLYVDKGRITFDTFLFLYLFLFSFVPIFVFIKPNGRNNNRVKNLPL